jgi:hypothetical protein
MTPEDRALKASQARAWRAANPERFAAIMARHHQKWVVENRDDFREMQREHRFDVRKEILDHLGGQRCVRCGFDDWRALCVDHINSDGRTDEKVPGKSNNPWTFKIALRDPVYRAAALLKYQVLCCNCNRLKQFDKNEFPGMMPKIPPHQHKRKDANGVKIRN